MKKNFIRLLTSVYRFRYYRYMKRGNSKPSDKTDADQPKADPFHFGSPVDPESEARVEAMKKRRAEKRKAAVAKVLARESQKQ